MKKNNQRFYDIEGKKLPSVTTVLGIIDKSGPLMGWAIKCMRQYAEKKFYQAVEEKTQMSFELVDIILAESSKNYRKVQQEALDIGSAMHNLLEVYLKGHRVDGLIEAMPLLERPFTLFKEWKSNHKMECIKTEHIIWSEKGYAGTTDFIGVVDGELVIADWKSSKAIYDEMLTQVAAYWMAYEERSGERLKKGGILRLPKTDTEKWEPEKNWVTIDRDEAVERFKEFQCLLRYFDLNKKRLDSKKK